jgi:hypothetical protein
VLSAASFKERGYFMAFKAQPEQQWNQSSQKDNAAADPFADVQPLSQYEKTCEKAPDRIKSVNQAGSGGGDVALVDILEGEAEHGREESTIED